MRQTLGNAAVGVVEHPLRIGTARLHVVSAIEAEAAALSEDRIVGYPIEGSLAALDTIMGAQLAQVLLADNSYAFDVRRCSNSYLLGVRFTRGAEKVEFALGMDCQQALWAFPVNEEVRRWGAFLGDVATQQVLRLLDGQR